MQRSIVLLVLATNALALAAQKLDSELAAVNASFGGTVVVKIDRSDRLVMDVYNGSGRFRQDLVPIMHLDPTAISFSAEEDAVVLGCKADKGHCIDKEIFKLSTIRRTGRSNLPRPANDSGGEATILAFRELIQAAQEQLTDAAGETRQRQERMK